VQETKEEIKEETSMNLRKVAITTEDNKMKVLETEESREKEIPTKT
jgi:hypothetical protein